MKNARIVRVAEWDGWCGACAADRPLVLTRTGRQRLRTWLTGAADDSRPLVLTCRLCGTGVDVPLERDDPAPFVDHESAPALPVPSQREPVVAALPVAAPAAPPAPSPELTTGRQVVAQALGALLAQRSAGGALAAASVLPIAVAPVAVAPALPLQRTASTGGLAELQLLADGIDLLSSGRA